MNAKALAVLAGVVFAPVPAAATLDTAQDLERGCKAVDTMQSNNPVADIEMAYCLGAIAGINETMALWKGISPPAPFCLPEKGITLEQSRRLFLKYLQENPLALSDRGGLVYIRAIHEAFPCPAK